ncbi:MAG TPA: FIST N-terminal domain-containing protein [Patescibacteria group bacterium]|nr:FIST N-terminal domain-containing protein [Patescibacteria group bacterium]
MLNPNEFAVAAHWTEGFDESALQIWAENLRRKLSAPSVTLGLVFMTPRFFSHAAQVLELLRVHAQIPLLVGCSSQGLIVGDQEVETNGGFVLGLYYLPGAELRAWHFTQEQVEEANGPAYWHLETGVNSDQTNGWLVFADPFHLDSERWLRSWNEAYAPLPILGGLASGEADEQVTQVYHNGDVYEGGGIAVSFGGRLKLASVTSQGCTPIGETWTITKVEENLIQKIGNRPAYEVLVETFNRLAAEEQKKARGNLFVGLVINEYLEDFHRGDFLIRNLLGADPQSGAIAVGALPRAGQTIQFQRRDAAAATEDIGALLQQTKRKLIGTTIYGGCLCSCNGRGHRLFGCSSHDARQVQEQLGPLGLAGFFCNGEIGPVGERNFLHGYTASLALFVKKMDGV